MDDFSKLGYLAPNLQERLDLANGKHAALFLLLPKLNQCAWAIQAELRVDNENPREILAACLYVRIVNLYQIGITLAHLGMKEELKVILRCILEPVFPLVAIEVDPDFTNELIRSEEYQRKDKFKKLRNLERRHQARQEQLDMFEALIEESTRKIEATGARDFRVRCIAEKAGMLDQYETIYALMSGTLHASVRSLEELLDIDDQRPRIDSLRNIPSSDEFESLLPALMESIIYGAIAVSRIFQFDLPNCVEEVREELHQHHAQIA